MLKNLGLFGCMLHVTTSSVVTNHDLWNDIIGVWSNFESVFSEMCEMEVVGSVLYYLHTHSFLL